MKRLATASEMLLQQKLAQGAHPDTGLQGLTLNIPSAYPIGSVVTTKYYRTQVNADGREEVKPLPKPATGEVIEHDGEFLVVDLTEPPYGRTLIRPEDVMDAQPRESKLAQDYSWAEDFEPDALGGQENDRDRVAEVWKRVENAIYQGPDSALPEVIKILESIPEVIALAATREREQIAQDWRSRFDSEEEYPHPQQSEINDMPSGPSDAEGRL